MKPLDQLKIQGNTEPNADLIYEYMAEVVNETHSDVHVDYINFNRKAPDEIKKESA